MKHSLRAFTLVELVVVITIVGILSTIGFVSYTGYLTSSRDSNRLSEITTMSDSLLLYSTRKFLPFPTDFVEITASGSENVIGYQGYLSDEILQTIDYNNGGTDPKDDTFYTYYLLRDKRSFQLMTLMEDKSSISFNQNINILNGNTTFALDYSKRYPKVYGKNLGILVSNDEETINQPIQDLAPGTTIDVKDNSLNLSAIISDSRIESGTGFELISGAISLIAGDSYDSCNSILQNKPITQSIDSIYTINSGDGKMSVYCDMTLDGGGWTMVAHAIGEGTSIMNHQDIISWTPRNSENCSLDNECISSFGEGHKTWSDLLVHTRGYSVKGTQCNDLDISVKGYAELPYLSQLTATNWDSLTNGAHGKCDELSEVSQGLVVPDLSTNSNWPVRMGIQVTSNDNINEHSLLFYGPIYIPQGLGTQRNTGKAKMDNFYGGDKTGHANDWHGASMDEQVWFIR